MEEEAARDARGETFDPDRIHAIFKLAWRRRTERGGGGEEIIDVEPVPETSRRNRSTTANSSALQVSCELLRMFVTEAVQRSAVIAEAEARPPSSPPTSSVSCHSFFWTSEGIQLFSVPIQMDG